MMRLGVISSLLGIGGLGLVGDEVGVVIEGFVVMYV